MINNSANTAQVNANQARTSPPPYVSPQILVEGKNVNFKGPKDQTINVLARVSESTIKTGKKDDRVHIEGDHNKTNTKAGNDVAKVDGDNNKTKTRRGNDKADVHGNSNTTKLGKGSDLGTINGDNNKTKLGRGNDFVAVSGNGNLTNGGRGHDTAVLDGNRSDYSIKVVDGLTQITNKQTGECNSFKNMESYQFADGTIDQDCIADDAHGNGNPPPPTVVY